MNRKNSIVIVSILAIIVIAGSFFIFKDRANTNVVENKSGIQIFSPKENELISSPLKITGLVNGDGWTAFEGQVGIVRLFDSNNKELALGILTATEEWMKLPVNFETTLFFDYPGDGIGKLVFYNENASGEPERDKTFTLPVTLQKSFSDSMVVKTYFGNNITEVSCDTVFYAERRIQKTQAPAGVALEQLLSGPTNLETRAGFFTTISPGVKVQSLVITDGVAKVDFNGELQKGVAGSCKVTAIRAQIEETLKQFSTVKSVIISIDGKTEDILQP